MLERILQRNVVRKFRIYSKMIYTESDDRLCVYFLPANTRHTLNFTLQRPTLIALSQIAQQKLCAAQFYSEQ